MMANRSRWFFAHRSVALTLILIGALTIGLAADVEPVRPIDHYVIRGLPGPESRTAETFDEVYRLILAKLDEIDGPITIRVVRKPRPKPPRFSYYTDGPPDNPIIHGECYSIEVDRQGAYRIGVIRSPEYNSVDLKLDKDTDITDELGYGMEAKYLRRGDIITVWRDDDKAVKIRRVGHHPR